VGTPGHANSWALPWPVIEPQKIKPTLVSFHKRGRIAAMLSLNETASRRNPKTPIHCSFDHKHGVVRKQESNIDPVTRLPIRAVVPPAMKAAFVSANLMNWVSI
jgi:hypothetical protein